MALEDCRLIEMTRESFCLRYRRPQCSPLNCWPPSMNGFGHQNGCELNSPVVIPAARLVQRDLRVD
ncbi:MAG: hypothetical protein CM15mP77_3020 [Synechococcus sp.]|nr:MAG: hypothetical protein CM15mP77_3020 [Synechococcus sp.]